MQTLNTEHILSCMKSYRRHSTLMLIPWPSRKLNTIHIECGQTTIKGILGSLVVAFDSPMERSDLIK